MAKENKPVPTTGIETPEELAAINKALEEQVAAQQAEIESLKGKVAKANSGGRPVSTEPAEFTYNKKTYPFPAPKFHVPGFGTMTATEALEKPDVLAYLVEIKAGAID